MKYGNSHFGILALKQAFISEVNLAHLIHTNQELKRNPVSAHRYSFLNTKKAV